MVFFTWYPSTYDPKDIPGLSGKVAVVTGGNAGIGYHTTLHLALHKAKVYVLARSDGKARDAIQRMKHIDSTLQIEYVHLDLSRLESVELAVEQILKVEEKIDILVCNAGVVAIEQEYTIDGVETNFQINYLGHFYLIRALLPCIKRAKEGRIVLISSDSHRLYPTNDMTFDKLESVNKRRCFLQRYGQSKLAMVLAAQELSARLPSFPVFVNTVNPGAVNTALLRNVFLSHSRLLAWLYDWIAPYVTLSPDVGAFTTLYVATSDDIRRDGIRGTYFEPICRIGQAHEFARDTKRQEALWNLSEGLLRERGFEIPKAD